MQNREIRKLVARLVDSSNEEDYLAEIKPNKIGIANRSLAYGIALDKTGESERKLHSEVEEYNEYVRFLRGVDGLREVFDSHQWTLTRSIASQRWDADTVDRIFSLKGYVFNTKLIREGDLLYALTPKMRYAVRIGDEEHMIDVSYYIPEWTSKKKDVRYIWNNHEEQRDGENDFLLYLWDICMQHNILPDGSKPYERYQGFEMYEPYLAGTNANFMRVKEVLIDMGYLHVYSITPEDGHPLWKYYYKDDGRLEVGVLNLGFKKNSLAVERILLILKASCTKVKEMPYILTDESGRQYLSKSRGALGGNRRLKIYGRLDCPSANRYVRQGKYAQHRVFFRNEKTAIAAGYRPCAVCMKEEYEIWKEHRPKQSQHE